MRFKGLDLNLLVTLDILLETRNVSRAAEQLHLSQPAVSAALGRLRTYFDDPLLALDGKRMIPTPYAMQMRPLLKQLLIDADQMISIRPQFDPAKSTRWFRVGSSDFVTSVLFTPLMRRLSVIAPGIGIELIPPSDSIQNALESADIDLLIIPSEHVNFGHPNEPLFDEIHVVAGWSENPIFKRAVTPADFTDAGHVVVEIGQQFRDSFAEVQLRLAGISRKIDVSVSSFSIVPELLIETTRLAMMHERLAKAAQRHFDIAFAPLPFAFPPMREVVQYHRSRSDDPGLRWLIAEIRNTLA